jgi:hypothetical protein
MTPVKADKISVADAAQQILNQGSNAAPLGRACLGGPTGLGVAADKSAMRRSVEREGRRRWAGVPKELKLKRKLKARAPACH